MVILIEKGRLCIIFTLLLFISVRIFKAMPNWNYVKRQLKFDKPRYLFTKTHNPKTKTQMFYDKNNALFIYLPEQTSS